MPSTTPIGTLACVEGAALLDVQLEVGMPGTGGPHGLLDADRIAADAAERVAHG